MKIKKNIEQYDVIIVYSESNPNKAKYKNEIGKVPFSSKGDCNIYNDSYSYFLLQCKRKEIKAAFATSNDIIGPGLVKSFWIFDKKWVRKESNAYSQVLFDKFTPNCLEEEKALELLTSSESISTFNNRQISEIFQNKYNTFRQFKEFAIPTVKIINPSKQEMILAKKELEVITQKHKGKKDFTDGYIIKDITGSGGFKIHKVFFNTAGFKQIQGNYELDKKSKEDLSYILQPFIKCDTGFSFKEYSGTIDLRIIILHNKIIQTYIRIAQEGKFECNIHQGGNLAYIPQEHIPKEILDMSKKIIKQLESKINLEHSLYALDFMQSNGGHTYFIEGNDTPGIIWESNNKIDEIKSKELIDIIVNECKVILKEKAVL